ELAARKRRERERNKKSGNPNRLHTRSNSIIHFWAMKFLSFMCQASGHRVCRSWGMIRKLTSGEFRLYSRKKNPKTGKRRNLGTFSSLAGAKKHERAVQFFKKG